MDADDAADSAQAKARRQSEGAPAPLIPDCCNAWVLLRIAALVNAGMFCVAMVPSTSLSTFMQVIGAFAAVVEPTLMLSLVSLCLLRRWANGWSVPAQWVTGIAVPAAAAAVTGIVVHGLIGEGEVIGLVAPAHVPHSLSAAAALSASGEAARSGLLASMLERCVVAALAAAALLEYFRLRARAYAPSFSEARLQALQARIRPHFLFNSLNTVLGLIRTEPRRAETTLENLADLFRVFMRDARELVPLDDEMLTCREYVAIECLRLGERLKVQWDTDAMPGDALIPSLLLQPLLENAVHHGIEPRTEPGLLSIRITHPNDRVRVEIVNPLSDVPPTRPGNQMALSNVRERLMLVYDKEATLRHQSGNGKFSLVLEFPYRRERRRRDVRRYFNPDR